MVQFHAWFFFVSPPKIWRDADETTRIGGRQKQTGVTKVAQFYAVLMEQHPADKNGNEAFIFWDAYHKHEDAVVSCLNWAHIRQAELKKQGEQSIQIKELKTMTVDLDTQKSSMKTTGYQVTSEKTSAKYTVNLVRQIK